MWCWTCCCGASRAALRRRQSGKAIDDERITGWLTASSLTDIFYIVRRSSSLAAAHDAVRFCLRIFVICGVDRTVIEDAVSLPGPDFEDNLQLACAARAQLDGIVTRDRNGFLAATLPVFSPAELITILYSFEE